MEYDGLSCQPHKPNTEQQYVAYKNSTHLLFMILSFLRARLNEGHFCIENILFLLFEMNSSRRW